MSDHNSIHTNQQTDQLIAMAIAEDLGAKMDDITSRYFIKPTTLAHATIFAKQTGVATGQSLLPSIAAKIAPQLTAKILTSDGSSVAPNQPIAELTGSLIDILKTERIALNFMQRLSGISTLTQQFYQQLPATSKVAILDTRKTTPGWRHLEKFAVLKGGGSNHRMGLYDRIMIKENHLAYQKSDAELTAIIQKIKTENPTILIQFEAETVAQVMRLLNLQLIDMILLDNMPTNVMRHIIQQAQKLCNQKSWQLPFFEASGNISLTNVALVATTGVNAISIGALTHSSPCFDFTLLVK